MEYKVKYFKFFDPENPLILTKDIGVDVTAETHYMQAHLVDGEWVPEDSKAQSSQVTEQFYPKYEDIEEISKEEYDFLDTTGECEKVTKRRQENFIQLEKLQAVETPMIEVPKEYISQRQAEIKAAKLKEFEALK